MMGMNRLKQQSLSQGISVDQMTEEPELDEWVDILSLSDCR
jgi:hypothetical protein